MKFKLLIFYLFCFFCSLLNSAIIEINQDGSGDYTVIQNGINASVVGDTIRVYPGTYYENLVIEKSLSLVSNYEFTGNENDIDSTILDGNYESSVIRLQGEEYGYINVYLCGFVVQHGTGWGYYHNEGGGIRSEYVYFTMKKNIIKDNRAYAGGGLFLNYTITDLIGNFIHHNNAYCYGGGMILVSYCDLIFNTEILNNIYLNYAGEGADMFKSYLCPQIEVLVDTFTVMNPDFYSLYAYNNGGIYQPGDITYNIQHSKIEQVEHDLYVSSDGNDNNSGLTAEESLQNIHYALTKIKADSLHHRTVHIADGLYSPSLNNQYFPLHMKSYVSVIGESRDNTILDAELGIGHIYARDFLETNAGFLQRDYSVKNMKLINGYYKPAVYIQKNHNVFLENIEIANYELWLYSLIRSLYTHINMNKIYVHDMQGGRSCYINGANGYTVNLTDFKINNNYPSEDPECPLGCGFWISNNATMSQPDYVANILNTQITNNINHVTDWPNMESAITILQWSKVNLINSTISGNESYTGGAVVVSYESELNVYNSILYGDIPREIVLDGSNGHTNTLSVQNSLVEGGLDGVLSIGYNNINWNTNNLDEDPLFFGTADNPFTLSNNSPCIDAGTLNLPEGIELPEYDLAGNPRIYGETVDMGAYEWQGYAVGEEPLDNSIKLTSAPNPFRNETVISFQLPKTGIVNLTIYNIKGQKVITLLDAYSSPGNFQANWKGVDRHGYPVSNGAYFAKLIVDDKEKAVRKLIKLRD
ncbi:MAG: choice-of-anchor Q domain-containing protein [Candidatus Cloacimonadota bacterium]|nr:choice-of-anchor Q domain-containing protein [Candidatus Cloacimonadota bacterium]